MIDDYLYGHKIYLATKEYQRRKHHKKRINKKWLKRYGCYEINMMPHGEVVLWDGDFWMTKKTFQELCNKMGWRVEQQTESKEI